MSKLMDTLFVQLLCRTPVEKLCLTVEMKCDHSHHNTETILS